MTKHIKLQKDYTASCLYYQIKLPLDIEKKIPSDDPVRLLSAFVEGMELSDLYHTYGKIKKDQASPGQLLKIVIYVGMNRIYSSRDIEKACRRDINFMYLLEGKPAPDHATIARFISLHLSQCSKKFLANVSNILFELGELSGKHIFIDGTKIESAANRYTFVWKKAVTKSQTKLAAKITELIAECEEKYGLKLVYRDSVSLHSLKRIRKKLYALKKSEGITFVYGIGRRKSALQKSIDCIPVGNGTVMPRQIRMQPLCG
jgi:transposase